MNTSRFKVALLVALSACSNSAVPSNLAAKPVVPPAVVQAVAQQTALVTLDLHPDGSVDVIGITRKPIPFRGVGLSPFDSSKPRAPGTYALIVQPPGATSVPQLVPLELGAKGEGGGDVIDRWKGGAILVRAPSFGEGTRYTIARQGAAGLEPLSERTEAP